MATKTKSSTAKESTTRNYRKVRRGYVVSDKMDRTAVVEVVSRVKHPLYGKIMRKNKKFHVHDPENTLNIGDLVTIMETKPLSKTKHFRLLEIIERAK